MARTVNTVKPTDSESVRNLDGVKDAVRKIPQLWYSEMKVLDIEFTASKLDQTIAHKLSGKHKYWLIIGLTAGTWRQIHSTAVSDSKLTDTHIRLIANGACTCSILVAR
jgi:hypothetical protein